MLRARVELHHWKRVFALGELNLQRVGALEELRLVEEGLLFLVNLLEKTGGNVMQAARLSGMDRSQLHHMISKFNLDTDDFRS